MKGANNVGCKGNTCCPDGSTCHSSSKEFMSCPTPKEEDCTIAPPALTPSPTPPTPLPPTPTPSPMPPCKVGDMVLCPGSARVQCAGDRCCPGLWQDWMWQNTLRNMLIGEDPEPDSMASGTSNAQVLPWTIGCDDSLYVDTVGISVLCTC